MQWFLALAESSPAFESYADMVKVAVHTALRHTSLQPHFLYRGGENHLTAWLRARNIPIIPCRTFLENEVATIECGKHTERIRPALHGVLLRIELPQLSAQLNLDERVLYTDCDVFFRTEVTEDLDEVLGERVVVVDDEDLHRYSQPGCSAASRIALKTASAFDNDSRYS